MIARITAAYIRKYRDNGQVKAYVDWVDDRGRAGRTEGPAEPTRFPGIAGTGFGTASLHLAALFARAEQEGVLIERHW